MTPELQAVVERLEETEKQVSHLASLVVAQSDTDRTLVARRFTVTDTEGKERAILGMHEGWPFLELYDADEHRQVRLCLDEPSAGEVAWLGFYDREGKLRLDARVHDKYGPRLLLRNKDTNAALQLREEGLFVGDATKGPRVDLSVEGNTPRLLFGKDNKVFWSAPPTSSPDPMQADSNVKGDSASMSQSWIARVRDRAFEWVLLSSLRLFIWFAFLAIPFLGLAFMLNALFYTLHLLGAVPGAPSDSEFYYITFAGIVISLLLCIGLRAGAFDKVLANEK